MREYRFPNQRAKGTYKGGRKKQTHPNWSWFITREDALNVLDANRFASVAGVPINAHATINFSDAVPHELVPKIVAAIVKNFRQWLRRKGYSGADTTHIWVREHPAARHAHVHLLLHVPKGIRLSNRQVSSWIPSAAGIDRRTIKNSAQDHSGAPIIVKQRDGVSEIWGRYVLKGIARGEGAALGLDRLEKQGRLAGKRVGVAENVASQARTDWKWHVDNWGEEFARTKWIESASMPKRLAR